MGHRRILPLLPFRSLGILVLSMTHISLSCINEYLAIDSGGNVSEIVSRNCFQEKPSWCRNEQREDVQSASSGPDTALYKTYLYITLTVHTLKWMLLLSMSGNPDWKKNPFILP